MNGIHDMGGMHGFGPIEIEEDEPVFHQPWEGRVYGIVTTIRDAHDVYGPYGSRSYIESIPPDRYLVASYYEKWMLALENALLAKGLLSKEELEAKTSEYLDNPGAAVPRREDPEATQRVVENIRLRLPLAKDPDADIRPAFQVGDAVKARNINLRGHSRLPRYVRGKVGTIEKLYKIQDFQDHVPESEQGPQPVYSVRFKAEELWGAAAEGNQSLYIDMWESYLESA
ncbi:MAG: nitrile hydratase subunit beta [Chloroflexi bacterium]|nr:nitrile hydratase subunit beta [Chloroflexota bacterium]